MICKCDSFAVAANRIVGCPNQFDPWYQRKGSVEGSTLRRGCWSVAQLIAYLDEYLVCRTASRVQPSVELARVGREPEQLSAAQLEVYAMLSDERWTAMAS